MNLKSCRIPPYVFSLLMTCDVLSHAQHMNAPEMRCVKDGATDWECYHALAVSAERELDGTYTSIRDILDRSDIEQLARAQSLWLQFRQAACKAEEDLYQGGTGGPVTYQACLASLARQRRADLLTTYGWRLEKSAK